MGGLVAEEIVFGEEYKSIGSSSDIYNATNLTGKFVRKYGMNGIISSIVEPHIQTTADLNFDIEKTNEIIEI